MSFVDDRFDTTQPLHHGTNAMKAAELFERAYNADTKAGGRDLRRMIHLQLKKSFGAEGMASFYANMPRYLYGETSDGRGYDPDLMDPEKGFDNRFKIENLDVSESPILFDLNNTAGYPTSPYPSPALDLSNAQPHHYKSGQGPALTPSHLTGPKMGSAPQPALQTGAYAPELPVNDVERPLTEAQKHAILTEPAVNMHYAANNNLVPANTDSINAHQGDIVSDNTGITGDYTEEAKKELFGPTANEISDNRRSGILMNQDPARYLRDGSSLDDGMGNIYRLEGGDKDDVFQSLVKRYLDEGFGQKEAIAKADEQMKKPALQLLKENAAELGTFMMDKLGSEGERNYWPYVPFENTELGRYLESKGTTEAREALPSMKDAERMKRINNPLSGTGGALTDPSTDNGKAALTVTEQQQQQLAPSKPTQSTVRSTTGGHTGNARGSDLPDMQIGLNERLMRMGAAGLAAGGQGSLAQMGAMFGASSDVNQANRQGAMDTFKIEEARRQAHADRVAKLAAAKAKGAGDLSKVKDYQGKSFGFYNRGVDAERVLSQLDGQGTEFWKTVGSKVPIFGNALVGSEYRQYDQARRNFLNAVLRRESGAVISEKEFEEGNKQYFPQFGDEEAEILQKRENRRTTMLGIRISAGDTMQYTSDYPTSGLVTQIGNMKITEAPAKTAK